MRSFGGTFGLLDAMRSAPIRTMVRSAHYTLPEFGSYMAASGGTIPTSSLCAPSSRSTGPALMPGGPLFRGNFTTSVIGCRSIPPTASTSSNAPSPLTAYQRDQWMSLSNKSRGFGSLRTHAKPRAAMWSPLQLGQGTGRNFCHARAHRPAAGEGVCRLRFLGEQVHTALQWRTHRDSAWHLQSDHGRSPGF